MQQVNLKWVYSNWLSIRGTFSENEGKPWFYCNHSKQFHSEPNTKWEVGRNKLNSFCNITEPTCSNYVARGKNEHGLTW